MGETLGAAIPRVLIAGTGSGCGKTTLTCAVLQAMTDRGRSLAPFKCGPDYIDPMFHARITGTACANLDPFFFSENTLRQILAKHAANRDLAVIEGVMGYYDGLGMTEDASTYAVAAATETPVVLAADDRGAALSVLATVQGFLNFAPESRIRGVIFNRCSPMRYPELAKAVTERFQGRLRPLGCLPPLPECSLESRHLGLVTAAEVRSLGQKLRDLARAAEEHIDLDGLEELAREAAPLSYAPPELPRFSEPVRIGVAMDRAFCFYYEDNLELLRALGAELAEFSPLRDPHLPRSIHGLYLGGGYPELYGRELGANATLRREICAALTLGMPCIAECGGFMYLTEKIGDHPAVGFLPGVCRDTGRLSRFGYIRLTAKEDNLLCKAGDSFPAHEFHRWDWDRTGNGFAAEKPTGRRWEAAVATKSLYAGFPHFHFFAAPRLAVNFYQACVKEKQRYV